MGQSVRGDRARYDHIRAFIHHGIGSYPVEQRVCSFARAGPHMPNARGETHVPNTHVDRVKHASRDRQIVDRAMVDPVVDVISAIAFPQRLVLLKLSAY